MKLTRIDIHGFKSFYRKTVILFGNGITGIVGPNGCGKSNIVDAIKWVMGEQGARSLRGTAMEDVIFAGTKQRGPLGFCEVKLTFEGAEHLPPSPRYPHGPTLCVERRLERGKGSDYFINRKRCRLSDIQEILAGTGVGVGQGGRRAYAIIEQGQIDQVVSAKADERRFLIEEAAGVTRYRQRRRIAERKLAQTDQNLQRVGDIVEEVERQLRSLRRQAKKAERYRDYRAEATRIGLKQCAVDLGGLENDIAVAGGALAMAIEQTDASKLALETELAAGAALEIDLKAKADRLSEAKQALGQYEEEAKLTRERLAGFAREQGVVLEQVERAKNDLESGESQLSVLETERAEVELAVESLSSQVADEEIALNTLSATERQAAEAYLVARSKVEGCFRRESEQKHQITVQTYRIRTAEERLQQAEERLSRLSNEADIQPRLASTREALAEVSASLEKTSHSVARLERAREDGYQWGRAFSAVGDELAKQYRKTQDELSRAEARCEGLKTLHSGAEMLGKGTDLLIGEDGISGALLDLFESQPAFQRAGVAALDAAASAAIADNLEVALKQIGKLEEEGLAATVVLQDVPWFSEQVEWAETPKEFGLSDSTISARLLGTVALVESLSEAPQRFLSSPNLLRVVTADGHSLDRSGILRSWGTNVANEMLERRAEIQQLEQEIKAQSSLLEALSDDRTQISSVLEFASTANQSVSQQYSQVRVNFSELKAQHRQTSSELERLEAYSERLAKEREELFEVKRLSTEDLTAGRIALKAAEQNLTDFSTEIDAATENRRQAEIMRDKAAMNTQSSRARIAGLAERLASLKATLSRLSRQEREVSVRRERFDEMSQSSTARLASIRERVTKDEMGLGNAEAQAIRWADKTTEYRADYDRVNDALNKHQADVRRLRASVDSCKETRNQKQLRLESAQLRVEALSERVRDRFKLDIEALKEQFEGEISISDEERARLIELDNLLEKLGDVNLSAIEDYETTNERYEFLVEQRKDLTQAVTDLNEAMKKIDETSKVLFREAFEKINELFQELFPRLFKGGEGRLSLTNPSDLLTTGIDIHCQPPGKKLQSVDLMSGGEKAMCALALIFAVFRYRPSPFCILDEVDAPLDDVNIGRFNEVVRVLSGSSQVVLVTHNKRTMEIADSLYGVTMEESGVSKLVGVQMT